MSGPEMIDVAEGMVRWRDGTTQREAAVPGAVDARYDPATDRLLVLTRDGASGAVAILSREGECLRTVMPSAGYAVSHFADSGPSIVCQGEAPHEGWSDWHFTIDPEDGVMRRAGPAY